MKKSLRFILSTLAALPLVAPLAHAAKDSVVTAVFSRVAKDYKRVLAEDGSPKPEFYSIVNGKYLPGSLSDKSIDEVEFPEIANVLAQYLTKQNYYPAPDMGSAQLLLVVSWGTTVPFDDGVYRNGLDQFSNTMNLVNSTAAAAAANPGMTIEGIQSPQAAIAQAAASEGEQAILMMATFEDMRMRANEHNARLLGYMDEINYRNVPSRFGGAGDLYNDLITDIENERYFVIIAAYDFQAALKEGRSRPVWITRVSVEKHGNKFDKVLATMLARASDYFGNESKRLVRRYYDGKVTIGELKVVGYEDEETPQEEKAPEKP